MWRGEAEQGGGPPVQGPGTQCRRRLAEKVASEPRPDRGEGVDTWVSEEGCSRERLRNRKRDG